MMVGEWWFGQGLQPQVKRAFNNEYHIMSEYSSDTGEAMRVAQHQIDIWMAKEDKNKGVGMVWPRQSSDLNHIEMLWGDLYDICA